MEECGEQTTFSWAVPENCSGSLHDFLPLLLSATYLTGLTRLEIKLETALLMYHADEGGDP